MAAFSTVQSWYSQSRKGQEIQEAADPKAAFRDMVDLYRREFAAEQILTAMDEAGVDRLIEWCQEGPRSARVEHVDVLPETPTGEFQGFRIR